MSQGETQDLVSSDRRDRPRVPGALAIFSEGRPLCAAIPLVDGASVLGRDPELGITDDRVSRQHARVSLTRGAWTVTDEDSRNGTFVNAHRIEGTVPAEAPRVVRLGYTIYLLLDDLRPYLGGPRAITVQSDLVYGPRFEAALELVGRAAASDSLLVTGESGSGKEIVAPRFHAAGPGGPFLSVNCAAIPEGVAERLLFGAVRGAYSGAVADAQGYIEAADGGVLFLDEIGDLDPAVQPKLLRVLETREVVPLGASRGRTVATRFCFATFRNLRAAMGEGRFRPDLYYRVARTEVHLPPLRERLEEIPWLAVEELRRTGAPPAHARLVETCLMRAWPGNVRELLTALRRASDEARAQGAAATKAEHLDDDAGRPVAMAEDARPVHPDDVTRDRLVAAITDHRGNLSAVARALGLHRSQLYRLLERHGLKP